MTRESPRQGAIVVKFDEPTDMALAIHAIRMGKKRVSRNGRETLADHSKADAVVELVGRGLAATVDGFGGAAGPDASNEQAREPGLFSGAQTGKGPAS